MPVETEADRRAFFDEAEFADRALWRPQVGAPRFVSGIFDAEHESVELDEAGVPVQSVNPVLMMQTGEMPGVKEGDGLRMETVNGVPVAAGSHDYTVRHVQPDGTGVTVLTLEKVD